MCREALADFFFLKRLKFIPSVVVYVTGHFENPDAPVTLARNNSGSSQS